MLCRKMSSIPRVRQFASRDACWAISSRIRSGSCGGVGHVQGRHHSSTSASYYMSKQSKYNHYRLFSGHSKCRYIPSLYTNCKFQAYDPSAPASLGIYNDRDARYFSSSGDTSNSNGSETDEISKRLSVAIVGAGPSGFYAAKYLTSSVLKRITSQSTKSIGDEGVVEKSSNPISFNWSGIDVDIIERLPTPYGLVRYGVAPDHPEVKNVENDFAALFQKQQQGHVGVDNRNTTPSSTLSYFGNVDVGKDVSLSTLQSLYHVVILAYGCQEADRRLGLAGEDTLEGVLSAREFVAWYNGHPEFAYIGPIVQRCLWQSSSLPKDDSQVSPANVVVIGQGNVALDVSRVLAKGRPGLLDTDTPNSVLDVLCGGATKVSVVGRRGHVQGAFTIKELRELTKLKKEGHDASFIVRKEELDLGMTDSSQAELKGPSGRPKTRINKLLQESALSDDSESNTSKQVELRFLLSPTALEPNNTNTERIGSVICERTKLEGEPFQQRPIKTGETETFPADLVLVSIGYRGMPLEGMDELFDHQKGVVANDHGKVEGDNNLFVTGWIKRGPTGIIGTNIMDAKDTVASVMRQIDSEGVDTEDVVNGRDGLSEQLQVEGVHAIDWDKFLNIEAAETERSRLRSDAQPREKILSVEEMLKAAS